MGQLGTGRRNRTGADGRSQGTGSTSGGSTGKPLVAGGYPDDGSRHMPIYGEDARTAQMIRDRLVSKSGRAATNLAGTRTYLSSFLGSTS